MHTGTVILLPPTKEEVHVFARVCFVCLSVSKITRKRVEEMLRVDRCRDMDELINF